MTAPFSTVKKYAAHSIFALMLLAGTSMTAHAAPETYIVDSSHANIGFKINHFGFSNPDGKFPDATGTLVLDAAKPEASTVKISIPVDHVLTGIPKLDEHLKGADFFDTAKYPTATFTSTKVEVTGKDTAKVTGNLDLHGVVKPVTLDVKLNQLGENMFKKKTAGFSATTALKRSDFGIKTYLPALGDDVKISIELEANLQAPDTNK